MNTIKLFILICLMLLFLGKVNAQQTNKPETAITYQWAEFSQKWEAEDAQSCAEFYGENGINIPPEQKIKTGREDIAAFYDFLFSLHESSTYTHKTIHLDTWENRAVEQGEFTVNWIRNDGTEWSFTARSLAHWTKNDQGTWQIAQFIFNKSPEN